MNSKTFPFLSVKKLTISNKCKNFYSMFMWWWSRADKACESYCTTLTKYLFRGGGYDRVKFPNYSLLCAKSPSAKYQLPLNFGWLRSWHVPIHIWGFWDEIWNVFVRVRYQQTPERALYTLSVLPFNYELWVTVIFLFFYQVMRRKRLKTIVVIDVFRNKLPDLGWLWPPLIFLTSFQVQKFGISYQ